MTDGKVFTMRKKRILRQALVVSTVVGALATTRSSPAQTCTTDVTSHFGWTVPNPITAQIYWPNARSDIQSLAIDWVSQLTDSNFYTPVTEYHINQGTWGGIYQPTGLPHGTSSMQTVTLSDTQIQDGIVSTLQQQGALPLAGEVYLIFLPQYTTAQMDSTPGDHGYHGWGERQLWDGNTHLIVYGVVEYNGGDFNLTNIAASHELYEMFTDPLPIPIGNGKIQCTGYCNGNDELADMCANQLGGLFGGFWQGDFGMELAQVWSQNYCECYPFVAL
jgi:hypothetical protein